MGCSNMIFMSVVWCSVIASIRGTPTANISTLSNETTLRRGLEIIHDDDSKVIGGRKAKSGEFKWMVSLQYADAATHYCGGVLLTLDKVLTACHCVAFYKDDFDEELFPLHDKLMVAGSVSNVINPKDPYQQIRHPVKTFCHPKCRSRRRGGFDWDFSIHDVDKDFEQTPTVKPCSFVSLTSGVAWKYLVEQVKKEAWCTAVGWGYSKINNGTYSHPSKDLLKVGVTLLSFTKCHHFLKTFDTYYDKLNLKSRYQVCALGPNQSDVCKGDSGGGLVCGSHVYGIVSWGPVCGELEVPSMYTAIDGVWDFMLKTVFNENAKPHSNQNLLIASFILAIQKRRGGFTNDYGIMKPASAFNLSATLGPVMVVSMTNGVVWSHLVQLIKQRKWCAAVGWGTTNFTRKGNKVIYMNTSSELKAIGVALVSFAECRRLLQSFDKAYSKVRIKSKFQVCTMNRNSSVCKGDSGGGLVCGRYVYGILSWGPGCGEINTPSMYAVLDGNWQLVFKHSTNDVSFTFRHSIFSMVILAISINVVLNT
ncbi:hypothetical protein GE061_006916 [Apolygus lucorum]|uniref:Peptidase S1 domain-containing protein n=1 Tax=Apolygus lucorum TaxID=248454 RepID=A0A8S9WQG7_APOLU|nr:hypothetical protein GE061_006916 [Apolygus lucorum]